MGKFRFLATFTVLSLLSFHSLSHADIDELLSRYSGENGKGYVQPLATGFGAGLNSGLYNSAEIKRFGLRFQLELRLTMMLYTDGQRTFEASTGGHFYPPAKVIAPTIIGDGGGAEVTGDGGTKYHFPGGLEVDALFLACPQVTVGSFFGTEGTIRFMALPLGEDVGTMRLWGVGARHSLSQYISTLPVDLAIGTFYQRFTLGDIIDANLLSVHMIGSKSLPLVTFYGGVGYESCTMHMGYTLDVGDLERQVEFDLEGKNRFRGTVGVGLRLLILNVNADLSFGRQTVVSVGIGPGI